MFRKFDMFLIVAMLCAAAYTYSAKHTTKRLQKELAAVESQIAEQKDTMALLNAEWGLLTQPAKLQVLVDQFGDELNLMTLDPGQIVTIDDIPMRPERNKEIDDIMARELGQGLAENPILGLAENPILGLDESVTTGGVKP